MPPCAAFECERTGWTFDMIATETPSSAAARAARWPARPAPITRTSCEGKAAAMLLERLRGPLLHQVGPQGAPYLVRGHDPAQHAVRVNREQRAELRQALGREQRFERRVLVDL